MLGLRLRGFPGWWVTRSYHLLQLPLLSRKLRVVADWTVALFFRRDIVELGGLGHPRGAGGGAALAARGRFVRPRSGDERQLLTTDTPPVRRFTRESLLVLAAAFAVGPPALIHFFARQDVSFDGMVHFFAVGMSALVAAAAARSR